MTSQITTALVFSIGLAAMGTASIADEKHHGAETSMDQKQSDKPYFGKSGMQGMGGNHSKMMKMHAGMMQSKESGEHMKDMQIKALLQSAKADVAGTLAAHDASGDGVLDVNEVAHWYAAVMRPQFVDGFQHLDADGSGDVSNEELEAAVKRTASAKVMPDMAGGNHSAKGSE